MSRRHRAVAAGATVIVALGLTASGAAPPGAGTAGLAPDGHTSRLSARSPTTGPGSSQGGGQPDATAGDAGGPPAVAGPGPLITTTSTTGVGTGTAGVGVGVEVAVPRPPPLGWSACDGDRECSTLVVPLDYARPEGRYIGVALERRRASNPAHRIGSVVLNPGGPGDSGVLNLTKDLAVLPAEVPARFDVVAFDPRGVGGSERVRCGGDLFRGPAPDPVPPTMMAAAPLIAADQAYAASCAASSGDLLAHVGTLDVARDLEGLRQALGEPGLTYVGLSYGTLLGALYAGMFPTHVRAMVLDGAIDPALTTDALADAQARGFERSLDAFFAWCTADPGACAWHPSGDPRAAFARLAGSVRDHPLATAARTVGLSQFYTGVFGTLYARSFWPSLGRALAAVARGDGAPLLGLYDGYQGTGDPAFSGDANNAVTCLDHPVADDYSSYLGRAASAASIAPDFGSLFTWAEMSCARWPVPAGAKRQPGPITAAGSGPILVIGTTQDPATPYAWAQSLASELAHGALLTRVGVDHVAIFYSACARTADRAVLVSLQLPAEGTICSS